jgi:hypothetical protein
MTFKRMERSGLAYVNIIFQDLLSAAATNQQTMAGNDKYITSQGRDGVSTCIIAGD